MTVHADPPDPPDLHYDTLLALAGAGPDETDPLGHPPAPPAVCPVCQQRFVDAGAPVPECHRCGAVLTHTPDRTIR